MDERTESRVLFLASVALAIFGIFVPFRWHEMSSWVTNSALALSLLLCLWAIGLAIPSPAKKGRKLLASLLISGGITAFVCGVVLLVTKEEPPAQNPAKETDKASPVAPKSENTQSKPLYRSLAQLFENDFPNAMKVIFDSPYDFNDTANGIAEKAIPVRTAIYADYTARTEFVGYYIPHTEHAHQLILELPNYLTDKIKEAHDRAPVIFKDPKNMAPPETSFTFSGRVFIYHEDELTPAQTGALWEAYNKRGLSVQFRGPEYPIRVWHEAGSRPEGGKGGSGEIFGNNGTIIGGKGGRVGTGGVGRGGDGGGGIIHGDGGTIIGGEGGSVDGADIWYPPAQSAYIQYLEGQGQTPDFGVQYPGAGGASSGWIDRQEIVSKIRDDYFKKTKEDAKLKSSKIEDVPLEYINEKLKEGGYPWRARIDKKYWYLYYVPME